MYTPPLSCSQKMSTFSETTRKHHSSHGNRHRNHFRGNYASYSNVPMYAPHYADAPAFAESSQGYRFDDPLRDESEFKGFMDDGKDCEKLFKELTDKMNNRYRKYAKLEMEIFKRHNELKTDAKDLAEEKKRVAAMMQEALAMRVQNDKELDEIRREREQMERASTDFAIQLAELKRAQREMEKRMRDQKANEEPGTLSIPKSTQALAEVNQGRTAQQSDDGLDDIPLSKRMKVSKLENSKKKENGSHKKSVSIQTALQEDAPGLYEILQEKGLIEDMDIITNVWEGDLEDQNSQDDDFIELAAVVSKIWGLSAGLMKENRTRIQSANSNKPSYCLPCLTSLVEQTRFLKQRKWPVKWGWCRPLHSFLFVFEKHNRIVVERPEYGYATYFFEIVQSMPIKWQVERLIKVMSSVANCRAALLENRPLEVGKDLLPQEAAVLEDYGWTLHTGIGSLLNFCDRVLHDYKTEDEMMEWRCKIGKLLMDGHDHGSIVLKVPRRFHGSAEAYNLLMGDTTSIVVKRENDVTQEGPADGNKMYGQIQVKQEPR